MIRRGAAAAAGLLTTLALLGPLPAPVRAQGTLVIGVVYFYTPTPLTPVDAVIPEQFATETLTAMLTKATQGTATVIPRAVMARAEAAMRWQEGDALRFGRLSALAQAVGATQLIVGWMPMFSVSGGGSGSPPFDPNGGGNVPMAQATVVVQVFDPGRGRLVAETRHYGYSVGLGRLLVAEQAIQDALAPTVPYVMQVLFTPAQ